MSSLKNKIDEYVQALSQDGLDPKFLYLDEDETKNLIGFKVTEPGNYLNIDSALDQLINKLGIKYIVIVGGYDRFPQAPVRGTMETWAETDDKYADVTGDNDPEISVGRVIDPNDGDIDLLLKSFDTFTSLHKSGGLDISKPIISTPSSACGPSRTERCLTGECFSKNILGDSCPSSKCIHDSRFYNTVSNNFLYYVEHGSPSVPQSYDSFTSNNVASATFSNNLLFTAPCWGGNIKDYSKTSDSIPMTFFKNGGAVFLGSTDPNCCALSYTGSCSTDIDEWGVGALYYQIAKKMSAGKRIGDAYREGKSEYLKSANLIYFPKTSQAGINCLYGDPTLKINKMW